MQQSDFTIIYWNTWFDMQDGRRGNGSLVCDRLQKLIDTYQPDALGLNEVYCQGDYKDASAVKCLEANDYHVYFAPVVSATTSNGEFLTGNVFASKQKPASITDCAFGQNAKSRISWYTDYTPNIIEAKLEINGQLITVLTTHLGVMVPADIITHIKHRRSYNRLIDSYDTKNLIIGGDFNELKYMPPWLHLPSHLKRKTGNLWHQTWLLNARQSSILRGNMDNLIYSTAGNLKLTDFKVLKRYPSDHTPLLGQFRVQ